MGLFLILYRIHPYHPLIDDQPIHSNPAVQADIDKQRIGLTFDDQLLVVLGKPQIN